jgi:hypothetical protein
VLVLSLLVFGRPDDSYRDNTLSAISFWQKKLKRMSLQSLTQKQSRLDSQILILYPCIKKVILKKWQ